MKKIFLIFLALVLPIQGYASLNTKEETIIDFYTQRAGKIIEKKGVNYKNIIIFSLEEKLSTYKEGTKKYDVFKKLISNISDYGNDKQMLEYYEKNKINITALKTAWLTWQNKARKDLKLQTYSYSKNLELTAFDWSYVSMGKKDMDHKRNSGDSYYDYKKITSWFADRGVVCKNIKGTTNSESIGWGNFYCYDNDCNNEVEEVMKQIFDMYMAEKGLKYPADAHYRAIIHNDFKYIGLGIAIQKNTEKDNYYKLYMTTHYCTDFIN